jgi:hypothetical protein
MKVATRSMAEISDGVNEAGEDPMLVDTISDDQQCARQVSMECHETYTTKEVMEMQ